jgi:hypothetical protein
MARYAINTNLASHAVFHKLAEPLDDGQDVISTMHCAPQPSIYGHQNSAPCYGCCQAFSLAYLRMLCAFGTGNAPEQAVNLSPSLPLSLSLSSKMSAASNIDVSRAANNASEQPCL